MSAEYQLGPDGWLGAELFNSQSYYQCHDVFEKIWLTKSGEEKFYYQGLIQVAVAFYKVKVERNYKGATSLLKTGTALLRKVDPAKVEVDLPALINQSLKALEEIERLGPENMAMMNPESYPKIPKL